MPGEYVEDGASDRGWLECARDGGDGGSQSVAMASADGARDGASARFHSSASNCRDSPLKKSR